jgi:hypothetical protein
MQVLSQRHKGYILFLLVFLLMVNMSIAIADEGSATEDATPATPATTATDETTPASDATQTTTPQEQTNTGSVARTVFTSQIIDREPTDDITSLANDKHRIYFFTDLRGMAGQIITHQWEYNGKVMAEVKFKVGEGPRWRVYSSKNLLPEWTGNWKVSVVDEAGHTLATGAFEYTQATDQEQPATSKGPANNQKP